MVIKGLSQPSSPACGSEVSQGSEPSSLVALDTGTSLYARAQQRYFSSYTPVIGFYVYESAPYWNTSVQRDLLEYAEGFQRISWLESYLDYLREQNLTTTSQSRDSFTRMLRLSFLRQPQFAHFADDIIFAERDEGEEPEMAASRVFLVAKTTENKREEMSVLLDTLRRLSLTSRVRFLIFNPSFVYLDRWDGSTGTTAVWIYCTLDLLNTGSTADWIYCTLELLQSGSTADWIYCTLNLLQSGSTEHWIYYSLDLLNTGSTADWIFCSLDLLNTGSSAVWIYCTLDLLKTGSTEHWIYCSLDLLNTGSTEHWIYCRLDLLQSGSTAVWIN
ncbi:patched domain-containing protein 1-like [Salvelinus alpinus]